jgi:glycine/D-amino acid oxidase-like deaminating enzyme
MDHFDVAVIGSGALGASTAFHLAKQGRTVALIDKASIGSQTSPRAAGLSGQLRRSEVMTSLARRSVDKIVRFTDETGEPMEFYQPGSMNIARNAEIAAMLPKSVAWGKSLGLDIDLLSPEEAHERMPFLETTGVLAATHMRTDVYLEPAQIALGYARGAERLGAVLMPDTRVDAIVSESGLVSRLGTSRGEIGATAVVDAAGGWARRVATMAGGDALLVPMRHQLMITEPLAGVETTQPIVRIVDVNVYVRPASGGLMLGGYERSPKAIDTRALPRTFRIEDLELDIGVLRQLAEEVEEQFPIFRNAKVAVHRGGLPTMTIDGEHIVGPAPGVDGLFLIAGCNVGGLSISPALGEELARWIVEGQPSVDLSRMSPSRFAAQVGEQALIDAARIRYAHYYNPPPVLPVAY